MKLIVHLIYSALIISLLGACSTIEARSDRLPAEFRFQKELPKGEPCAVVVGFDWIPPDRVGSKFTNPTVACAERMSDSGAHIFSSPPIGVPSTQKTPLEMDNILSGIERSHPGCMIIGLGFLDPAYRKAPFTDDSGKPRLQIETDRSGNPKYMPMFLPNNLVRGEVSALNEMTTVGGFDLSSPTPVDPAGPFSVENKDWIAALQKCSAGDPEIIIGYDRDPGADVCDQEAYLLNRKGLGGFLHISDCADNTTAALRRLVTCLKEHFSLIIRSIADRKTI